MFCIDTNLKITRLMYTFYFQSYEILRVQWIHLMAIVSSVSTLVVYGYPHIIHDLHD